MYIMNSPNPTTNIQQNTQPTVLVPYHKGIGKTYSSPRNPNNNERKMATPPTYLIDENKTNGLWRPNATEGRNLMRDYKNEKKGGKTKRKSSKKRKTRKKNKK